MSKTKDMLLLLIILISTVLPLGTEGRSPCSPSWSNLQLRPLTFSRSLQGTHLAFQPLDPSRGTRLMMNSSSHSFGVEIVQPVSRRAGGIQLWDYLPQDQFSNAVAPTGASSVDQMVFLNNYRLEVRLYNMSNSSEVIRDIVEATPALGRNGAVGPLGQPLPAHLPTIPYGMAKELGGISYANYTYPFERGEAIVQFDVSKAGYWWMEMTVLDIHDTLNSNGVVFPTLTSSVIYVYDPADHQQQQQSINNNNNAGEQTDSSISVDSLTQVTYGGLWFDRRSRFEINSTICAALETPIPPIKVWAYNTLVRPLTFIPTNLSISAQLIHPDTGEEFIGALTTNSFTPIKDPITGGVYFNVVGLRPLRWLTAIRPILYIGLNETSAQAEKLGPALYLRLDLQRTSTPHCQLEWDRTLLYPQLNQHRGLAPMKWTSGTIIPELRVDVLSSASTLDTATSGVVALLRPSYGCQGRLFGNTAVPVIGGIAIFRGVQLNTTKRATDRNYDQSSFCRIICELSGNISLPLSSRWIQLWDPNNRFYKEEFGGALLTSKQLLSSGGASLTMPTVFVEIPDFNADDSNARPSEAVTLRFYTSELNSVFTDSLIDARSYVPGQEGGTGSLEWIVSCEKLPIITEQEAQLAFASTASETTVIWSNIRFNRLAAEAEAKTQLEIRSRIATGSVSSQVDYYDDEEPRLLFQLRNVETGGIHYELESGPLRFLTSTKSVGLRFALNGQVFSDSWQNNLVIRLQEATPRISFEFLNLDGSVDVSNNESSVIVVSDSTLTEHRAYATAGVVNFGNMKVVNAHSGGMTRMTFIAGGEGSRPVTGQMLYTGEIMVLESDEASATSGEDANSTSSSSSSTQTNALENAIVRAYGSSGVSLHTIYLTPSTGNFELPPILLRVEDLQEQPIDLSDIVDASQPLERALKMTLSTQGQTLEHQFYTERVVNLEEGSNPPLGGGFGALFRGLRLRNTRSVPQTLAMSLCIVTGEAIRNCAVIRAAVDFNTVPLQVSASFQTHMTSSSSSSSTTDLATTHPFNVSYTVVGPTGEPVIDQSFSVRVSSTVSLDANASSTKIRSSASAGVGTFRDLTFRGPESILVDAVTTFTFTGVSTDSNPTPINSLSEAMFVETERPLPSRFPLLSIDVFTPLYTFQRQRWVHNLALHLNMDPLRIVVNRVAAGRSGAWSGTRIEFQISPPRSTSKLKQPTEQIINQILTLQRDCDTEKFSFYRSFYANAPPECDSKEFLSRIEAARHCEAADGRQSRCNCFGPLFREMGSLCVDDSMMPQVCSHVSRCGQPEIEDVCDQVTTGIVVQVLIVVGICTAVIVGTGFIFLLHRRGGRISRARPVMSKNTHLVKGKRRVRPEEVLF